MGRAVRACGDVVRAGWLSRQAIASRGQDAGVEHLKLMNRLPRKIGPQNEVRGALFYEIIEILFCYAQLLENLIKSQLTISLWP